MADFIHHTGLTVADLERALAFWRDALGMQERMSQRKQGGYFEAIVGEPGADVRMVHLGCPPDGPPCIVPGGQSPVHRSRDALAELPRRSAQQVVDFFAGA